MRQVGGLSLIARAARVLAHVPMVDARIISTDSQRYADEGVRAGLAAPFLRPAELSDDRATAADTMRHALLEAERHFGERYPIVLIIEPTSPLRRAVDIERAVELLVETAADSVVTVSPLPAKSHPHKLLAVREGWLGFHDAAGAGINARQELSGGLYCRNGVCYALTRECLLERGAIITDRTMPLVIERPVVNIDEPIELALAELLLAAEEPPTPRAGMSDGPLA